MLKTMAFEKIEYNVLQADQTVRLKLVKRNCKVLLSQLERMVLDFHGLVRTQIIIHMTVKYVHIQ